MNLHGDTTDKAALVERCKNGDREAFGSLYSTFAPRMMRVVCHYVDDWQAAQDVLHDGFLIVFSRIGQLRNADSLEYWMASIMKNLALQYLREADITCLLNDDFEAMEIPDFEESITMEQLEVMINRLPLGYRSVFRLAVLEHKSHKEIAKILGISEQTSGSQLYHARVMLRRMINEYRIEAGIIAIVAVLLTGIWLWTGRSDTPASPVLVSDTRQPQKRKIQEQQPRERQQERETRPADNKDLDIPEPAIPTAPPAAAVVDTPPPVPAAPDTMPHYRLIDSEQQYVAQQPEAEPVAAGSRGYEVALAGTFSSGQQNGDRWMIPGNPDTNDPGYLVTEDVDYHLPVSVELTVAKAIGRRWNVSTGVRYTLHRTTRSLEYQSAAGAQWVEKQHISAHYLGVPLSVRYRAFSTGRFSLYATAGTAVEFPLHAAMTRRLSHTGNIPSEILNQPARVSFHAPVLWSLSAGVTLQYRISPSVAIYMQPAATYTIPTASPYPLLPASRPWSFTIPIGLSFTP